MYIALGHYMYTSLVYTSDERWETFFRNGWQIADLRYEQKGMRESSY